MADLKTAGEQALEQPEQAEPVAWMMVNKTHNLGPSLHWQPQTDWHITWEAVPLYTHPPRRKTEQEPVALEKLLHQVTYGDFNADNTDDLKLALAARKEFAALQPRREWQSLSEEEIIDAVRESDLDWQQGWTLEDSEPNRYTQLTRAIEAKLKEKNA